MRAHMAVGLCGSDTSPVVLVCGLLSDWAQMLSPVRGLLLEWWGPPNTALGR